MTTHAAQCMFCRHAKRRGCLPVACARFADPDDTQAVLNAILYQLAGKARCCQMQRFEAPADAYMAQDDPKARTIGDLIAASSALLGATMYKDHPAESELVIRAIEQAQGKSHDR